MYQNLAYWLLMMGFPWDDDANEYEVGQCLTFEDAQHIMQIVARGAEFDLDDNEARQKIDQIDSPYCKFIRTYTSLMLAAEYSLRWEDVLKKVLHPADKAACDTMMYRCYL